ncbi:DUF4373 domain-containing protein [Aliarcobacter skirrowii]|uniref:Lin1244/Lin1753 domain-containing protein n=1 Tax=Aliarcobacter skirrowii TaxID=28200 RepID=UPI0029B644AD|nr:Lin1244/Lin1753 domain-containing protein [Aliarcobacter skirrowii]MDX4060202.1 DUF4373 domain-containing protein [Aliarcobacter skirrowii]
MGVPSFLLPSNFRNQKNIKRVIKEFDIQGYGIVLYLLETLAETENHLYPYNDIDLLADEMRVSTQKIETVIKRYGVFEIIQTSEGDLFFSSSLNDWLKPYYEAKQQRQIAGKISAEKRKIKQKEQLAQLSQLDSTQRSLNVRSTINEINELINKSINKESNSSSSLKKFNFENEKDFELFFQWLLENSSSEIKNERFYRNTILENLKNKEARTLENWESFCRFKSEEEKMIFQLRIEKLAGSTLLYKNELLYIERVEIEEESFKIHFDNKVMNLLFSQLEEVEKLIKKDAW